MTADLQAHNVWKIHSFLTANPTKQNLQNSAKNIKETIMHIIKFLNLTAKTFLTNLKGKILSKAETRNYLLYGVQCKTYLLGISD